MSDSTILRAIASPFHFLHFPKYIPSHDILRRGNAAILGNQLLVRHIDLVKEPLWSIITLRKSWLNYHTQASCFTLLRFISLKSLLKLSIFRGQEQNGTALTTCLWEGGNRCAEVRDRYQGVRRWCQERDIADNCVSYKRSLHWCEDGNWDAGFEEGGCCMYSRSCVRKAEEGWVRHWIIQKLIFLEI